MRHLEYEIAHLEKELAQTGHLDALNGADILLQMPTGVSLDKVPDFNELEFRPSTSGTVGLGDAVTSPVPAVDPLTQTILLSETVQSMISATLPQGPGLTDLVSRVRMGLTPSSASAVVQSSISNDITRSLGYRTSFTFSSSKTIELRVLRSIPAEIIQSLAQKFVHKVLPQYPFFHEGSLWTIVSQVTEQVRQHQEQESVSPGPITLAPSYDFLVLYLILAISITLGSTKGGHEARCIALSAS